MRTEANRHCRAWIPSIAAALFAMAIASPVSAADLTFGGGPVGGGWYMIGGGIADIVQSEHPDFSVRVVPGGSVTNPPRVSTGDIDIALGLSITNEEAKAGGARYDEQYDDFRMIAGGFNMTYYQIVARTDLPADTFEELIAQKMGVAITTPGLETTGGATVEALFNVNGATLDDLSAWGGVHYQADHSAQADLMRDGQADVLMTLLQVPATSIISVSTVRDLKFLPLSEATIEKMQKEYGWGRGLIRAEPYRGSVEMDSDIPTITLASNLIVNKDVPEDVVYKFTKALFENAERVQRIHASMKDFDVEEIVKAEHRGSIELHPGAQRYFEEAGYDYQ